MAGINYRWPSPGSDRRLINAPIFLSEPLIESAKISFATLTNVEQYIPAMTAQDHHQGMSGL